MIAEEIAKVEKGVSAKEKGDESIEKHQVTMTAGNITNKGKETIVDDDFSHGLVDLSTLSPLQALKLATQAQIKASEDRLKS